MRLEPEFGEEPLGLPRLVLLLEGGLGRQRGVLPLRRVVHHVRRDRSLKVHIQRIPDRKKIRTETNGTELNRIASHWEKDGKSQ